MHILISRVCPDKKKGSTWSDGLLPAVASDGCHELLFVKHKHKRSYAKPLSACIEVWSACLRVLNALIMDEFQR